ncbi:MAG: GIY-YIG nuclease family protein [Phaeovulum sp.]|uniref:GIY-YIG nuclease family protein n=1 Tax=Phaeovulum sp. TaxID=2934796 RepID=UPI002735959B|nr:GIY-YIG nuclease family protein [Phaeovulum sp.]MDP3860138.1 GIY-YIG nuclease family protein [Phaeovulum sp.]
MISATELADEMGCRKQTVFKIARRIGVQGRPERREEARGQAVTVFGDDEATLIRQNLATTKVEAIPRDSLMSDNGYFYIMQIEPNLDPGRIKVGFASDVDARLRKHRTAAPFSQLLHQWPCKSLWEKTAIEAICFNCEKLHTEVFRSGSLSEVIERGNAFFSLLPPLQ